MQVLSPTGFFKPDKKKKLTAIGLNIYGGGFTVGALRNFNVLGQWEEINLARKTFDLNFANIPRPLKFNEWPVDEFKGVNLVYGNPPCAPWSNASNVKGRNMDHRFGDPRLELTEHTMRTALKLKPEVFVLESVENAYNYGKSFYTQYVNAWLEAGYAVTYFLTDAVLHGAPCRRRRFHFFAHRVAIDFGPEPVDINPVTVRDCIGDLKKKKLGSDLMHYEISRGRWNEAKYRPILKTVPVKGKLINYLPDDFDGVRPSMMCQRLGWDSIAPTVVGFNYLIHPDGNRWITFREGMRLMTYPDQFIARVDVPDATDTVLPLMGEVLTGLAKRAIENKKRVKPVHTIIDWRHHGKKFWR